MREAAPYARALGGSLGGYGGVVGKRRGNETPQASAHLQSIGELVTAVNAWCSDPSAAASTYGNIADWDTGRITDMSMLFHNKDTFNDPIGALTESAVNHWPTSLVFSVHCYHMAFFSGLQWIDWLHHILMVVIGAPLLITGEVSICAARI